MCGGARCQPFLPRKIGAKITFKGSMRFSSIKVSDYDNSAVVEVSLYSPLKHGLMCKF